MKFKVWDKVRLTRETLLRMRHDWLSLLWPSEFVVVKVYWDKVFYEDVDLLYIRDGCLELVPEEPEFTYWEEIEVQARGQDEWYKAIFICKIPWKYRSPYVCVEEGKKDNFKNWERYEIVRRDFARKLRPQLTRKEIAEKFWVSDDFILID